MEELFTLTFLLIYHEIFRLKRLLIRFILTINDIVDRGSVRWNLFNKSETITLFYIQEKYSNLFILFQLYFC